MVDDFIAEISAIILRNFKLKYFKGMRPLEVKARYVLWSLKRINRPKIGEMVYHEGNIGILIQGINAPYWDIYFSDGCDYDGYNYNDFTIKHIHEKDFRMKPLWQRFKYSFKTSYDFQINYWYSIDVRQPVGYVISYS